MFKNQVYIPRGFIYSQKLLCPNYLKMHCLLKLIALNEHFELDPAI
jgi:hypothetical protein